MERRVYHSIELLAVFRSVTDPLSLNRGTRSDSLDKTEAEYYQVRIFGGHRYGSFTRARVPEAAERPGYQPQPSARSLSGGRTGVVALGQ